MTILEAKKESLDLRMKAKELNQKALEVEKLIQERCIAVGKTLIKLGYAPKGYPNVEGSYDNWKEFSDKINLTFYQNTSNDSGTWIKHVQIPAFWITCDDDSYIPEVKVIVKERKRKERLKQKIKRLQKQL